ncbi:MAG: glutathione S-transferase [Bdellovibrionota bacterium]
MITLHHLNNSRSQRVLWLLEELGLEYKIEFYERDKQTSLAPSSLKKIHPLGKSPVLTDGDQVVAESGAIIEYLVGKYGAGKLKGTDPLKYSYWLHFAEGTAMSPLLLTLIFGKIESTPAPFFVRPILKMISGKVKKAFINPNLESIFGFIESELAKSEWFAGQEFSAADIQMSFPVEAAAARASKNVGPKTTAFLAKIQARPAYKKALARGGEYSIL